VHDVAADVHLHVDVHRTPVVEAGIDRLEGGDACRVRPLDAAQEVGARIARDRAGVDAERVAMPDVDRGIPDRLAARGVDDRQPKQQRPAALALGDVVAELLARDEVRAFRQLGRQNARDEARRHGERAGACRFRGVELQEGAAAAGCDGRTRKAEQRAAGQALVGAWVVLGSGHAPNLGADSESRLRDHRAETETV
jgi:hypothetical protein